MFFTEGARLVLPALRLPHQIFSATALLGACLLAGQCGTKPADVDHPPALERLRWGEAAAASAAALTTTGWQKGAETEGELTLTLPAKDTAPAPDSGEIQYDGSEFFSVHLYSEGDRLKLARLVRTDSKERIQRFLENTRKDYTLGEPVWEAPVREGGTETGNRFTTTLRLYETDELFIRVMSTLADIREAQLRGAETSEAEIQLYSKKFNEGLTREAIVLSLENAAE